MRKTLFCCCLIFGMMTLLTAGPEIILIFEQDEPMVIIPVEEHRVSMADLRVATLKEGYIQAFEDENGDYVPENTIFEGDLSVILYVLFEKIISSPEDVGSLNRY